MSLLFFLLNFNSIFVMFRIYLKLSIFLHKHHFITDTILEFGAIPHLLYHPLRSFFNRFLNRTKSFIILFLSPTVPSSNLYLLSFSVFSATSFGKHIFFSSSFTFKVNASQHPLFFCCHSKKQAHLNMFLSAYASSIKLDNFGGIFPLSPSLFIFRFFR